MKTGILGSFVISWSQTEVDGLADAPRGALSIGASWRWTGDAMRVDGPRDVIRLGASEAVTDLHNRAARKVARLAGITPPKSRDADRVGHLLDLGFQVTDGFHSYDVSVVDTGAPQGPLLMFHDELPPANTDLWVVEATMEALEVNRMVDQPTGVICFTPGTRIRTAEGDVPVEHIREGMRIQTKDNGCQEVHWIGHKRVTGARLFALPELRPVRLRANALGNHRPDADLLVSPAHRMLVKGAKARALFNTDEVLVAARDLIDDRFVARDFTVTEVTYIHLLLDRHEVVFANGLETESFLPEDESLAALNEAQRDRLIQGLPDVVQNPGSYGAPARRLLSRAEAAIMGSGI